MALTCGFYNSLVGTGDRKYDAKQLSSMFDGIINDGVFSSVGNAFHPTVTGTNNTVTIGTGKAWFNHTWTLLDTALPVALDVADPLLYRMDTIYLEVDTNDAVRANSIKVAKGATYAAIGSPVYAAMVNDGAKFQYPLVNVQRRPAATAVLVTDLNYAVSTFVNGLFAVYDATAITASWTTQFNTWFNTIKGQILTDLGTSLATRITALETLTAPWAAAFTALQNRASALENRTVVSTVTSTVGGITTAYVTLATAPVITGNGVKRFRITGSAMCVVSTVVADAFTISLWEDGVVIRESYAILSTGQGSSNAINITRSVIPAAGNHTYKMTAVRVTGTGTGSVTATASNPIEIVVEQISGV